jgi:isocitrate dehydrogenase
MMFEYMGWHDAAHLIIRSIEDAVVRKHVTADLFRMMPSARLHSTSQFADDLIKSMQK